MDAVVGAYYLEWRGVRARIREGDTVIGRGSDCELHIDDPTASRRHAVVRRQGSTMTVRDLGSRNGTFVDADRLHEARTLRGGEQLLIGETHFVVLVLPESEGLSGSELSLGIGPGVAPGLALVERRDASSECEHDVTAPHLGTIEVLEALTKGPHVGEEPQALAVMVQNSVERLLAAMDRRDDVLDDAATERLLAVISTVEGWFPDGSFGKVAGTLRRRLLP
ncbi:MAG: FHA domain-containing protein [Polyangiaceae bacterium]|nr:FHA domain-containing protein [Polyangiaceae bacterium]